MSDLQHKQRLLRKIKLNNGGGASVEWMDLYFDPGSSTYVKSSETRTSDGLVHDDLKAALQPFAEHLAIACEEVPEPKANYNFDGSLKGLDKFSVGSVVLRGGDGDPDGLDEPKPLQCFVFGNKRLKTGHKTNFGTPGIKPDSPQEQYKFGSYMAQHVAALTEEVWLYLSGKHAPVAQTALNLEAANEDDGDGVRLLEEAQ
jgi:hypothetical protein